MKRMNLTGNTGFIEFIDQMSEGNPGASVVLMSAIDGKAVAGFMNILNLDDMNIRGTQIWLGFKDYCKEDLKLFWESVQNRDANLVEAINRENAKQNGKYKAVVSGASYNNPEEIVFSEQEKKEFASKPKMVHPQAKEKAAETLKF